MITCHIAPPSAVDWLHVLLSACLHHVSNRQLSEREYVVSAQHHAVYTKKYTFGLVTSEGKRVENIPGMMLRLQQNRPHYNADALFLL